MDRNNLSAAMRFLKTFLILVLMVIVTVSATGVFIFALYRIATFSTPVYSVIFTIALLGSILLFVIRSIKRKNFGKFVTKLLKFLMSAVLVIIVTAAVLLYGAFFIRYIIAGIIATPVLLFIIFYAGIKWKPFSFYRKFYQNL